MAKDEAPPALFSRKVGGMWPANDAAEKMLSALKEDEVFEARLVRTRGNQKRLAHYWVIMAKAAEALNDRCEGDALDSELLHRVLKDRRGLYGLVTLPSGDVVKDYRSIGFSSMTEDERAAFIDWAFHTVAGWLGCSIQELKEG